MDTKFIVNYKDGSFHVSYYPSLNAFSTDRVSTVFEMFSNFIDSLEIQKEIDNVL